MVCSICNTPGHRANKCNSDFVVKWVGRLAFYWLGDPRLHHEAHLRNTNDERVMVWGRESTFGIQAWKRLWNQLDTIISERAAWRPAYLNFMRPIPQTIAGFKARIANYVRPNLPSILPLPPLPPQPQPEPTHTIKLVMVSDDSEFFEETDCVCCLNPLNPDNTVSFGCNHVTCSLCAPKVIKMVAGNCPTCRDNISRINFTQNLSPYAFNAILSSLT